MEKKYGKIVKFLGLIFVIISIIHIFYSSCSHRGIILDGSVFLMQMLDYMSNNEFRIVSNECFLRFFVNAIQELPALFLGAALYSKNKMMIAAVYSLAQFLTPLLFLWWNYVLTKRTKQYSVLFWSIFVYAAFILQYEVFPLTETVIGIPAQFVLLNYMLGKINYTKVDKIGIFFLILMMFGSGEHTVFIGSLIFACLFPALQEEENPNNAKIKIFIGAGSLIASVYCLIFYLCHLRELSDIICVFRKAADFWSNFFGLCVIIPILSIIIFCLVYFGGKKFTVKITATVSLFYLYFFLRMSALPNVYLFPVMEHHVTSIVYFLEPAIFLGICLYRYFKKDNQFELIKTAYVPVLLCGITLTCWQMVHTYYWNLNISYMKNQLKNCGKILYIPEEYGEKGEISSFRNKKLRRYIWMANYSSTALLLASDYKVKHFLVNYEKTLNPSDFSLRKYLYVLPEQELIAIPYHNILHIKNNFWDLTDCAEALHRYNKENNIETEE